MEKFVYKNLRISLIKEDITLFHADIIVNSANETLVGEDGVDGAIHIAAGPELQAECNMIGFCNLTDVIVTKAYNLHAKHIFHTVGPQWNGDSETASTLLTLTYYNNLKLGEVMGMKTIAFPSISTGQYGVPTSIGADSFVNAIYKFVTKDKPKSLTNITMVTHYDPDFDERSDIYAQFDKHLSKMTKKPTLYNKFFNRGS